ncbi:C-type lectin domain family 4 member E isoform X2 [Pleuronectes platessa]|uniref:C-type lectin domain family 4 member E isoform X2 n=1 Tax=Pleuronectes platessa TaxID=8262 RepID=UPI00232A2D60|nr:C-type lectin domain family 4 member E isoform X2 [Pleuronectes platessa]
MAEAEVLYNIKSTRARGNTDVATPSTDEPTYCNINYSETQRPGSKQPAASNRRSGVTSERVALLVLSVLLAAAVIALGVTHATCPRCEDGWEPHGGKCYFFSSVTLTWNESRKQCKSMRGDLVVINSREEQRFLQTRLRGKMENDEDKFWIGLTDSKKEDEWLWVDKTRLDQSWQFWLGKEPDNWNGENPDGENCVRMGEKDGAEDLKTWNDQSCKSVQKSICEKPEKA